MIMPPSPDTIYIKDLEVRCIIGIFRRERIRRQKILINLEIPCDVRRAARTDQIADAVDYKRISKRILRFVGESSFFLIETLAESLALMLLREFGLPRVRLSVSKPGAVRFSRDVGVTITRDRHALKAPEPGCTRTFISLGSNIRPERMMPRAVRLLEKEFPGSRFSRVYLSKAVGMNGARGFWNAVARVDTHLSPRRLKARLLGIEKRLGRRRTRDKFAPRAIDLDLVFYGRKTMRNAGLRLPHPDAAHAPYVLLPMAELDPDFRHPVLKKTVIELLGGLLTADHQFKAIKKTA